MIKLTGSLPVFVQQAAAAKAIRWVTFAHYIYVINALVHIRKCQKM